MEYFFKAKNIKYFFIITFLIFANGCSDNQRTDPNSSNLSDINKIYGDPAFSDNIDKTNIINNEIGMELLSQIKMLRDETLELKDRIDAIDKKNYEKVNKKYENNLNISTSFDNSIQRKQELHINTAAAVGEISRVINVVESGYDVNTLFEGRAPLHCAVTNGREKIVEYLLKNGANPNLLNFESKTPLDLANDYSRFELLPILKNGGSTNSQVIVKAIRKTDIKLDKNDIYSDDVDKLDEDNDLSLIIYESITEGSVEKLNAAIDKGYDLNRRIPSTVLSSEKYPRGILTSTLAIDLCKPQILEILISKGANIVHNLETGDLPLISCVKNIISLNHNSGGAAKIHDYKKIIRIIAKNQPDIVNKMDSFGYPLHYAASAMHEDLVELLLNAGGNPKLLDKNGYSPLHLAISAQDHSHDNHDSLEDESHAHGHQEEIAVMLLNNGANVNQANPKNMSPLMLACEKNYVVLGELLISKSANLNWSNNLGVTCMHIAALNGNVDFCKLLIDNNAKLNPRIISGPKKGSTPLSIAIAVSDSLDNTVPEIVKVLRDAGGKS